MTGPKMSRYYNRQNYQQFIGEEFYQQCQARSFSKAANTSRMYDLRKSSNYLNGRKHHIKNRSLKAKLILSTFALECNAFCSTFHCKCKTILTFSKVLPHCLFCPK